MSKGIDWVEILALVLRCNPARSAGKILGFVARKTGKNLRKKDRRKKFGVCSPENWKKFEKKRSKLKPPHIFGTFSERNFHQRPKWGGVLFLIDWYMSLYINSGTRSSKRQVRNMTKVVNVYIFRCTYTEII